MFVCSKCLKPPHYREWDEELVCENCLWFISPVNSFEEAIAEALELEQVIPDFEETEA